MLHPNTCNLGRDSRFKIPELDKPQLSTFFKPFQTLFFFISYNHGNKYTTECSKNQTGLENFKPKSTTLTNREELFSNIYIAITKNYKGNRGHILYNLLGSEKLRWEECNNSVTYNIIIVYLVNPKSQFVATPWLRWPITPPVCYNTAHGALSIHIFQTLSWKNSKGKLNFLVL